MSYFYKFSVFCFIGSSFLSSVFSQGSKLDSIQRINEVVVTANRYKEVIPSQSLKGVELENMSSLSVADAIRYFSGVQLKDYGGIGGLKTVNIRSMGTNHMGVFYNGIQLGNAQNGQVDLGKFSLDNIEEISLYNGQKSEIFQSAKEFSMAGSIYLTTRRPKFEEGKDVNMKLSLRGGYFDLLNPSILYEYKINDNISTTLNTEWINASGKYKFRYRRHNPVTNETAYDTTAVRKNGDIDAKRIEASVQGVYDFGIWKVHAYHYSSERGVPGAIVNNVWQRNERLWDKNSFIQASFQRELGRKVETKVSAKYAFDFTHYVNYETMIENIYKQRDLYISWANKYSIHKNWDVSAAYDLQWNELAAYMNVQRTSHWGSIATAATIADRLKVQASLLGLLIDEESRGRDSVPNKKKILPAIFLSYQPIPATGLVFRAFFKHSYRLPTFNDLYYADMGNPALKPEEAKQFNVGVRYDFLKNKKQTLSSLQVGVDAYHNREKNKIVAYPKGQQFRWTILNLGKVDIRGIDANIISEFQLPKEIQLTAKAQYTYQEAIDVSDDPAVHGHQIPYIPWHSGSFTAMLNWKSWTMNYSFMYVGERYNQQQNFWVNYTQPWYTHDVSIVKNLKFKKSEMRLTAEINNLLSQDYDVIINYPMPKRNYRLSVAITF